MQNDGYDAYHAGIAYCDCPHKHTDGENDKANKWWGGWLAASLESTDKRLEAQALAEGKRYDRDSGRIVDA